MRAGERSGAERDPDGYAPIGQYGVIGDGRSVALVAGDGAVDWWAVPTLDSTPAFSALLDPLGGGRLQLCPVADFSVERRYVPDTNVLETTYTTDGGQARLTDSLNTGVAGTLPWIELARRVDGLAGSVEFRAVVRPGNGLGSWSAWVRDDVRGPVLHAGELTLGVRCSDQVDVEVDGKEVRANLTVAAGDRAVIGIVASHHEPLFLSEADAIDARIDQTIRNWRSWTRQLSWAGEYHREVVRSALAMKLLIASRSGAIAAAATTSLPEHVGGPKNWDYRFSWVRDASMTIGALIACGLHEEVQAAARWLLNAIVDNGPGVHVMYTLEGAVPTSSSHAQVPGYKHSQPVMVGNDASSQVQLGVYGDLFGTIDAWIAEGHVLNTATSRQLAGLADACADTWRHADAGIWELHTDQQYTSSKINCWRALDRAATLAEQGHIAGSPSRWRMEAGLVREYVEQHCWSESKQAYTFYAGTDELDASVLLGARFGFDRGARMASTIEAIRSELGAGALLYRYSGADRQEQAFIACSYWLVEALAYSGRADEADSLMRQLAGVANPLGLMSEMCSPGTGDLLGNIPQALSHLSLINAARALHQARSGDPGT